MGWDVHGVGCVIWVLQRAHELRSIKNSSNNVVGRTPVVAGNTAQFSISNRFVLPLCPDSAVEFEIVKEARLMPGSARERCWWEGGPGAKVTALRGKGEVI